MMAGGSSEEERPRAAVLVLGMHRSGTSGLSGVLAHLGCAAPLTPIEAGRQNANGFFESRPVARLDDRILEAAGSSWHDWRAVDLAAPRPAEMAGFREAAEGLIAGEFAGSDLIVLKDPRICRLAPFWLEALAAASYRPAPVLIHRDPLEVAQSLKARNGFPLAFGVLLWLRHVLDAERLTRGRARAFTSYERLLSDWRAVAGAIQDRLGLALPRLPEADAGARVDAFLSAGLRHFAASPPDEPLDPIALDQARECLEIMERWAAGGEDGRDHEALDRIRSALARAGWAFVAPRSVKLERLEAELGAAREQATALEARVAGEVERRAALQGALERLHGAFLEMVDRSRELERERDRQVRELGALARLLGEADDRHGRSAAEARGLAGRVAELKGQLNAAERARAEVRRELDGRAERVAELKGQLNAARRAHEEAEERYRRVIGSSSWRVTSPLRSLTSRVRGP